jgi:hypothetical protein
MRRVTNLSITEAAARNLRQEAATFAPRPGEVFALVYMFSFTNPDGTTVAGFEPGYLAGGWPTKNIGPSWLLAELADGTEFHFRPRREWNAHVRYLVDAVGPLFSITPA